MEQIEKIELLLNAIEEGERIMNDLEVKVTAMYAELKELRKDICGFEHCMGECDSDDHCHMKDHCNDECKTSKICTVKINKNI